GVIDQEFIETEYPGLGTIRLNNGARIGSVKGILDSSLVKGGSIYPKYGYQSAATNNDHVICGPRFLIENPPSPQNNTYACLDNDRTYALWTAVSNSAGQPQYLFNVDIYHSGGLVGRISASDVKGKNTNPKGLVKDDVFYEVIHPTELLYPSGPGQQARGFVCITGQSNSAPVASNVSLTTAEDTAGTTTLQGTDAEGDALTYSIVAAPNAAYGTALITGNKVTFTPNANWNGTTSFTYRANDGELNSNIATVNVTVTPVNDAPVASNVSLTTAEDTAGTATLLGSDVDGDALTYSIVTAPNADHGTVSITGNKATFTPKANWNGTTSFTYRASDGELNSNTATVSVTVTPVNDAPVANNVSITTAEDTAGVATLLGTDVDGDTLTYSVVTAPNAAHGTVFIS